jgi:hypothetical protein
VLIGFLEYLQVIVNDFEGVLAASGQEFRYFQNEKTFPETFVFLKKIIPATSCTALNCIFLQFFSF